MHPRSARGLLDGLVALGTLERDGFLTRTPISPNVGGEEAFSGVQ